MPIICLKPDPSERAHQFVVGAIPIAAYLADWQAPVWAAVGLSLGAMLSSRLVIVSRLYDLIKHRSATSARPFFHDGVRRFDEATRATLLGLGLAVLLTGQPLGWLAVLGAAAAAILTSTTGFSFSAVLYALILGAGRGLVRRPRPGFGVPESAPQAASGQGGFQRGPGFKIPDTFPGQGLFPPGQGQAQTQAQIERQSGRFNPPQRKESPKAQAHEKRQGPVDVRQVETRQDSQRDQGDHKSFQGHEPGLVGETYFGFRDHCRYNVPETVPFRNSLVRSSTVEFRTPLQSW